MEENTDIIMTDHGDEDWSTTVLGGIARLGLRS